MASTEPERSRTVPVPREAGTGEAGDAMRGRPLQVERHDYVDLVTDGRERVQSMRGFDDVYTDIVDYIVRCTHRIWDERDVGLIYTHYTHNCVVYDAMGTRYDREELVHDTLARLAALPERRGMATQVIWNGDDVEGFYTSHLVTGSGRHSQPGPYGAPTGRAFASRTIADCMVFENRIYREWIVSDSMSVVKQLGLDAQGYARRAAERGLARGLPGVDIGENRRMLGQYPPETEPYLELAHNDLERETLSWLHDVMNRRMFGRIRDVYAPTVQYHGPLMAELYGVAAVTHQTLGLVASLPDAAFVPQHVCSTPSEEGGAKVAVRWVMEGHHLGHGILTELGEPTGKRVQVLGISHFHYKHGRIVDEWRAYDQMSMLIQVRQAQLTDRAGANDIDTDTP